MRSPSPAASTMALVGLTDIRATFSDSFCPGSDFSDSYRGNLTRTAIGRPRRNAITAGHDGCTTGVARHASSGLCDAPCRLLLVAGLRKLTPIWSPLTQASSQRRYARPVDDSSRKNSLQMQALDRAFDGQLGAGLRDVFHGALAPPGAVDAHHVRAGMPRSNMTRCCPCVRSDRHCPCSSPVISRLPRA